MVFEYLDCVSLTVPANALEFFEAALGSVCRAVSFFHNEDEGTWNIQGVKERGAHENELAASLAMAEMLSGHAPDVAKSIVPAGGWLARSDLSFPEQIIGHRFAIRGTHISTPPHPGRITLTLDAGIAFGTGEHSSTRGCLTAFEQISKKLRPKKNALDLGTGSGVLALAYAKSTHRPILATDIDPRATRTARANAALNNVSHLIHNLRANGWNNPTIQRAAPFDLVFANILARPLCAMASTLATHLRPGGIAILSGLLTTQANWVLLAHRRTGLVLLSRVTDGAWTTLILRRPGRV